MAKGPKGFSDIEKDELKAKLCVECERSWAVHGYKNKCGRIDKKDWNINRSVLLVIFF